MKWITREHPKIDRVACPWLIARFIDRQGEFLFAPPADVVRLARETGATPYDVEGVELSHDGPRCSFDAFLGKYRLSDPILAPQCAGLLAISLGLSHNFPDDHEMLRHGFDVYDALFAWLSYRRDETHTWNPQKGT
jgi:hypothetical protein